MEIIQSLVLGIVQGLTEFLPISSSGHLVLLPWALGWKDPGLAFDAALHLGTLLAIVAYFWKDWTDLIKNWRKPLVWLILIGCIPAGVAGLLLENYFETVFRSPLIVAPLMIGMGALLWMAEAVSKKQRDLGSINLFDSVFIGLSQILALMPGVSRSGITMTAGLFTGLKRETAARFSFLLSTPIILAAGLYKMKYVFSGGALQDQVLPFSVGIAASAIVGFFAIKYLLEYLKTRTFYIFVWYRFILGAIVLVSVYLRH